MAKYSHAYGGVGAPVGLTVFKTAGGSLGAVPGGFDSHTPLPKTFVIDCVPSGITLENQKIRSNFRKHPERASKASALILEFLPIVKLFPGVCFSSIGERRTSRRRSICPGTVIPIQTLLRDN